MKGEDLIFLTEAVISLSGSRQTMARFLLNREKSDRLLEIRNTLGREEFDKQLIKIKEVFSEHGSD